jgi:hypothetical protein
MTQPQTRSIAKQVHSNTNDEDYKLSGSTLAEITELIIESLAKSHSLHITGVRNKGHSHWFSLYDGKITVCIKKHTMYTMTHSPPKQQRIVKVIIYNDGAIIGYYNTIYSVDDNIIIDSKTIAEQFIESNILNLQNINTITNTIVNTTSTNASGSHLDKVIYFTLTLIVFITMWAKFNN